MITPMLLLLVSFISLVSCHRIAVIGGGISGTFVSKYLVEYDKGCSIDEISIFDPLPLGEPTSAATTSTDVNWQGSRLAAVRLEDDSVVEIGASVFYNGFHLIMDMVNGDPEHLQVGSAFNTGASPDLDPNLRTGMGIYNGMGDWRFFTANAPKVWALMKMAWRYNMDLYRVFSATNKVEFAFSIANQLLHSEHETTFFANAAEMWDAVGLLKAAHNTFDDFLDALGVCQSEEDLSWFRRNVLPYQGCLREELLEAVTLCNYNQGPSAVNGLVGLGSFVAAKVKLLSIVGGNPKMIASAFRQAQEQAKSREETCRANGKQPTIVRHVQHRVTTAVASLETMDIFGDEQELGEFDLVIMAAPLHVSRVNFLVQSQKDAVILQPMPFEMINVEDHTPDDGEHPSTSKPLPAYATRPYTQVVTTLVSGGIVNTSYFKLPSDDPSALPRSIYMTEHGKGLEHNITAISQITTTSGTYKVFSSAALPESLLTTLFGPTHKVELVKVWGGPHGGATPDYQGYGWTVDYMLYDAGRGLKGHSEGTALYYTNAIESSMACMELSAMGAKSVAKLVSKRLGFLLPHNGTKVETDEL
jgi:hypothetical protein